MIIKFKFFLLLRESLRCTWSTAYCWFWMLYKSCTLLFTLHSRKLESSIWKTLAPDFIAVTRTFAECSMNVSIVTKWIYCVSISPKISGCVRVVFLSLVFFFPFSYLFYFLIQFDCYLMRFSPSFWFYDRPIWIVVVHFSEPKNMYRNRVNEEIRMWLMAAIKFHFGHFRRVSKTVMKWWPHTITNYEIHAYFLLVNCVRLILIVNNMFQFQM